MFIVLYVLERINRRGQMPRKLNGLYLLFTLTLIFDSIWVLIDGNPALRELNIVVNLIYLTIMAMVGYLWFLYNLDMFPSKTKIKKFAYVLAIPVVIDIILVLTSPITGWVFTINQNGTYMRAPLHLVSFVINYTYILLGSLVALSARREATLTTDKRRLAVSAIFPLPILILTLIQLVLPPGLPAFQGGVLISLLLLYATYQHLLVTRDSLTSLPNRYAFESDLVDKINSYTEEKHLYLMEGDLDSFKMINDTLGHPAGDKILINTAEVLTRVFAPYGSLVFRVGGDEFMIIVESDEPIDQDALRNKINNELASAGRPLFDNLSMSLGIIEYSKDYDFKSLINSTDIDLYKVKSST